MCWTADHFSTKFSLMVLYHRPQCLTEKWDCCVEGQGHSKFQYMNKCVSRWYLLNRWTFYYKTWYGDASLWARLSFKKIGLLSARSRSQLRMIWSKYDWYVVWTADPFVAKLGAIVHYHKPECFMEKLDCCVQGEGQQNFKMSMNVYPDDIFWIAEPFMTKLGMVMHHYEPDCLSKRLVCCLQGQGNS